MDIEDCFDIIYQLEKVDGVNRYCSYLNYGPSKRDKILRTDQYIVFRDSCCGFKYRMIEKSGMVTVKNSYKAKEDYRELSVSNGFCRSSLEIVGNKIIHKQKGKREVQYVRELFRTHLIVTITVDKTVTLTKYYRAIDEEIMGMR